MRQFNVKKGGILWMIKQNLILGLTLELRRKCGLR